MGLNLERESDYVNLFIDDEIVIRNWVDNTNRFGRVFIPGWRHAGINRWDTDPQEFKAFLGLICLTGIMGWSNREEMFRRGQREVLFVHNTMTRRRFSTHMMV